MAMGLWLWGYWAMAMAVPMAKTSKHGENPRVMNLAKDVPGIRGLGEARVGWKAPPRMG